MRRRWPMAKPGPEKPTEIRVSPMDLQLGGGRHFAARESDDDSVGYVTGATRNAHVRIPAGRPTDVTEIRMWAQDRVAGEAWIMRGLKAARPYTG